MKTRLPSNLRRTTCECVRVDSRSHPRSREKDSCHAIRSTVAENPMLRANFTARMFYRTGVIADRSFTLHVWGFSTLLLLWPWPWPDDLHIRTWPGGYNWCVNMNFIRQGFRKLSSDRHTDRQTDIQTLAAHVVRPILHQYVRWDTFWHWCNIQTDVRNIGLCNILCQYVANMTACLILVKYSFNIAKILQRHY